MWPKSRTSVFVPVNRLTWVISSDALTVKMNFPRPACRTHDCTGSSRPRIERGVEFDGFEMLGVVLEPTVRRKFGRIEPASPMPVEPAGASHIDLRWRWSCARGCWSAGVTLPRQPRGAHLLLRVRHCSRAASPASLRVWLGVPPSWSVLRFDCSLFLKNSK